MKCESAKFGNIALHPECFSFRTSAGSIMSVWELHVYLNDNEIGEIGFDTQEQLACFLYAANELAQKFMETDDGEPMP